MKTTEKLEYYQSRIEAIDYDNREGGRYAYVQFMSYTREMLLLLKPLSVPEPRVRAIETINNVFNEYVGMRFTDHQRIIFDVRRRELSSIVRALTADLLELEEKKNDSPRLLPQGSVNGEVTVC